MLKQKYYFITYQATNRDGDTSVWNDVINESPMRHITRIREGDEVYRNFVVLNIHEITKNEYKVYEGHF